jgi:hypothetical protein
MWKLFWCPQKHRFFSSDKLDDSKKTFIIKMHQKGSVNTMIKTTQGDFKKITELINKHTDISGMYLNEGRMEVL